MFAAPSSPTGRLAVSAAVVFGLDQLTKLAAVAFLTDRDVRAGAFALTLVRNPGAAFSILTSYTWAFSVLAAAALAAAAVFRRRLTAASPGFVVGAAVGGIAGNLADRVLRAPSPFNGHVVDFVSVGSFPVFNLADAALVLAIGWGVYSALRAERHPSTAPGATSRNGRGHR